MAEVLDDLDDSPIVPMVKKWMSEREWVTFRLNLILVVVKDNSVVWNCHITFIRLTGDALSSCTAGVDDDNGFTVEVDVFDEGPVTSAKPLTWRSCAVLRKSLSCSWPMFTSPLYINLGRDKRSSNQFN